MIQRCCDQYHNLSLVGGLLESGQRYVSINITIIIITIINTTTIITIITTIMIQVVCQSLTIPGQSDVFQQIDRQYLQPKIMEVSSLS